MYYDAPHPVTDQQKLAAMVATLEGGAELPAVVVEPNGVRAICGSHRIAAYREVNRAVPALMLSEADYDAACERLGIEYLDEWSDYNDICHAVYETTTDAAIRSALADQIG